MTFEEARAELSRLADEAGHQNRSVDLVSHAASHRSETYGRMDEPTTHIFCIGLSHRWAAPTLEALVAKVRADLVPVTQGANPCP